jgi:hypothetical protein
MPGHAVRPASQDAGLVGMGAEVVHVHSASPASLLPPTPTDRGARQTSMAAAARPRLACHLGELCGRVAIGFKASTAHAIDWSNYYSPRWDRINAIPWYVTDYRYQAASR